MKPPPRLLEGGDLRAQLLRSARADAPGARSRRRATAAVALAVGALATRSTAALAAATVTRSALLKAILGAGVVTLLATGTPDAPPTRAPAEHAVLVQPAKQIAAPPPRHAPPVAPAVDPSEAPAPELEPQPAPASPPAAPAPTAARTAVPARAPNSLADEVALLGEAKRALEAGQTAAAFAALAAHDRRFPHAMLAQETAALRVEATARSGDRATAAALSRAFASTYPASPLRDRVRALGDGAP